MNTTSARRGASSWYYPIDGGDFDELVHYLETFTEAVSSELEITKTFEISVNPSLIKLNSDDVSFDTYKKDIKIFKLSCYL